MLQELWQHETSTFLAWRYRCHSYELLFKGKVKHFSTLKNAGDFLTLFHEQPQEAAKAKGGIKEKLCQRHQSQNSAVCVRSAPT